MVITILEKNANYENHKNIDLRKKLIECKHVPLITEIKFASPSKGTILDQNEYRN